MNNTCSHPYKWYDQRHLGKNRIHLCCDSCRLILKKGYIFRQSDYLNNNLNIQDNTRRIVWDDGEIEFLPQ